ncbi:AAA family ATPase [Ferrimonas balearica]|uniref:nucleotide-binding protein n=1 Tax=Ferrimonas balearica TaxID=44012 RepID=UPI001C999DEA|nr:AAA family ATPase [Ferrimonas balearica]MBY5993088.1 AAA family ATPase [Ferrimonas balearica]
MFSACPTDVPGLSPLASHLQPQALVSLSSYTGPRILMLNNKGGVGKSTITTQLLSQLIDSGQRPALVDFDPQGSSIQWATQRGGIWTADDDPRRARLESMRLRVPVDATQVVMDSPANLDPALLARLLSYADRILMPCQVSPVDIRALGHFLPALLFHPRFRARQPKLGVIANRVPPQLPPAQQTELLERFLNHLKIPLLARLPDRAAYRSAYDDHLGLPVNEDPDTWHTLLDWLKS